MSRRGRNVVSLDMQGELAARRELGAIAGRLPQVQERAIGTLRRRLPVEARRDIQAQYNIRASRVRKDLSVRSLPDGLKLVGHFRGIGLRNFGARQTRRGVTSAIFRGSPRSLDEGAFMAPLLGGGVHAVQRFGAKRPMTKGRYLGQQRQPLAVLYGPTLAQMLRKGRRPERLADYARNVLRTEVDRLLGAAVARTAGGSR